MRSNEKRGFLVSGSSLLNLSYGDRKDKQKSGTPMSETMRFQSMVSDNPGMSPQGRGNNRQINSTPNSINNTPSNVQQRTLSSNSGTPSRSSTQAEMQNTPDFWLKGSYASPYNMQQGSGGSRIDNRSRPHSNQSTPQQRNHASNQSTPDMHQQSVNNDFMNMWKGMQNVTPQSQQGTPQPLMSQTFAPPSDRQSNDNPVTKLFNDMTVAHQSQQRQNMENGQYQQNRNQDSNQHHNNQHNNRQQGNKQQKQETSKQQDSTGGVDKPSER